MARYAICQINDGLIVNVASWDGVVPFDPGSGLELIADPNGEAEIDGNWDGNSFSPAPSSPPVDSPGSTGPTPEYRIAALEADWSEGGVMRESIEAALALIPTKATNAPTDVASSGSVGAIDGKFALEDHAHAINATQQASINTLNSGMSVQQSLTGGLNTPAPATATPTALGSAAVGVGTKYAREDHVHALPTIPSASNSTPTALAATGASGSASAYSRDDHVHPLPTVATSIPSRTLNSAGFQPSTTKVVLVTYSVRITCTASLAGGQDGKIELMSDSNSTPTTVRATAQNRNSVSLAIALTAVNEQTTCLTYLVPIGHYIRLTSTQTTGTPAFSIVSQTETVIG